MTGRKEELARQLVGLLAREGFMRRADIADALGVRASYVDALIAVVKDTPGMLGGLRWVTARGKGVGVTHLLSEVDATRRQNARYIATHASRTVGGTVRRTTAEPAFVEASRTAVREAFSPHFSHA
jgi:hypothetical protein